MYKSLSFFGKLISFILLVIAMILIQNYNIFLLICGMIFILSFINKDKKYFLISLILFLITYILNFNESVFVILRISLVILYAFMIESSLLSLEKRYLYDKLFYRNRTSKKLKGYVYRYYYNDIFNKNNIMNRRIDKYLDVSEKNKYKKYLKKQTEVRSCLEVDNLYLLDRIRYDRFYSSKKSRLSFNWNNYDNFYIAVSLLLFVLVVVLGR